MHLIESNCHAKNNMCSIHYPKNLDQDMFSKNVNDLVLYYSILYLVFSFLVFIFSFYFVILKPRCIILY